MIVQKITHCTDSLLTQEMARINLEECQVAVTWFTNQNNKQSVVHSHPYYELTFLISGSDVQYSFLGNLYTLHLGELVFFPAEIYHAGRYTLTDTFSNRLVVQISADTWNKAMQISGITPAPQWQKDIVILNANAVSTWDLRGLLERMVQIPHLRKDCQETILICELIELQLFINQLVEEQRTESPSSTSTLISAAVEYIRDHYTDPNLTAASLAKYLFTSREHLSRAFKEYTMESIHSYIKNLRMQNCCREIASGHSVLEACTNSGFTNYSSFLKSFRALHGMTPMQYRAQLREMGKTQVSDNENIDL